MEYLEMRGAAKLKADADKAIVHSVLTTLRKTEFVDDGYMDIHFEGKIFKVSAQGMVSESYSIRALLAQLQEQLTETSMIGVSSVRRVESITQQITHYEKLRDKRLSSSYHQQWAESRANMDKITALKGVLTSLIEKSSLVGNMAAQQEVATSQFFSEVSRMMNVDIGLVRGISYGLLSLLLEVCTLAMISLTSTFNRSNSNPISKPVDEPVSHMDVDQQRAILQLTGDILNGRIPPVLRTIKTAHYGLDIDVIREVLRSLRFTGILTDDKRKSFKLNPSMQL